MGTLLFRKALVRETEAAKRGSGDAGKIGAGKTRP
jgi:hypothetical protein